MSSPESIPLPVHVISLGCPKNFVDTEGILGAMGLLCHGLRIVDDPAAARLLVVNTCAFIEPAVSESVETIIGLGETKKEGQILAVTGCLVWRYGREKLKELLPEVDLFLDIRDPLKRGSFIASMVGCCDCSGAEAGFSRVAGSTVRFLASHPWQRYLKIAEGCSNRCTYCLIPKIRGPLQCRSPESVLEEARVLEEQGAREITLVAQDLTAYNYSGEELTDLLEKLIANTSVPWFRLLYLYPERLSEGLIRLIAREPRICPYLDIPIQHASPRILHAMGRSYDPARLYELVEMVRDSLPDVAIRSTVITGFPGETDQDFHLLTEAIQRLAFDHLGCFVYWDEEGAAASRLPDKVPVELAEERREHIMELQAEISMERNRRFRNRILQVLVDGPCEETDLLLCGRSRFQAPEIDGQVYINSGVATPGEIARVKITESHQYDLIGHIIED